MKKMLKKSEVLREGYVAGLKKAHSIVNKMIKESYDGLKLYTNISEYRPWSGAVDTWDKIESADMVSELEDYLVDIYPDGLSVTELNDLLWFDGESVLSALGLGEGTDEEDEL